MTVYLPGSKIPFKPLNPWGRAMPKPSRDMKRQAPSTYQVQIEENATGRLLPVGPKTSLLAAEMFCEAISVNIAKGVEKAWSNPTIIEYRPHEKGGPQSTLADLLKV